MAKGELEGLVLSLSIIHGKVADVSYKLKRKGIPLWLQSLLQFMMSPAAASLGGFLAAFLTSLRHLIVLLLFFVIRDYY